MAKVRDSAHLYREMIDEGDFEALVAPVVPVIEEDSAEAAVSRGITCTSRRRKWIRATPRR
jgi:hypothetical protein